MDKKLVQWVIFLSVTKLLLAQPKDSTYFKNETISNFPTKISTRISLINTSNSFYFKNNDAQEIKMKPNFRDYLGLSVLFRSLELDLGYAPKFIHSNKDNKDSKLFNLNFRMFLGQFMQTFDVYFQKGFTTEYNQENQYFKNIKTYKLGGTSWYIFNKNFSFRAIGFQNEWQRKSAGSFIPKLSTYYTKYKFAEEQNNVEASTLDITISPSYYYNWVLSNHFLIAVGGSAGLGINQTKNFEEKRKTTIAYEYSGRFVFSYNSNTFFGGSTINYMHFNNQFSGIVKRNDYIPYFEVYLGYRFNAPKKWGAVAEKFNKKYGF